jgi:catabolite regulation protein CreA
MQQLFGGRRPARQAAVVHIFLHVAPKTQTPSKDMKLFAVSLIMLPLAAAFAPSQPVARSSSHHLQMSPSPHHEDSRPLVLAAENVKRGLAAGLLSLSVMTNLSSMMPTDITVANAAESTVVGEIAGSGLVFKDTLVVEQFDDPKVKGVSLYISNFQKPMTEKIAKGEIFSDPSFASVSCARTGKITIADNIVKGKQGEEVFEESKSLLFKTLRVQRIYDEERGVVVYVSFNTRLDKNSDSNKARFKSSTCAIGLN